MRRTVLSPHSDAAVFIALTFLTFFAWEQVSDVRLHPLRYLLLGLAYAIAATALVALLGCYITGACAGHVQHR